MLATMAMPGGRVQLEQHDMHLALDLPNMAKGRFSCATVQETQYQIKKRRTEVWEEEKLRVEFPLLR